MLRLWLTALLLGRDACWNNTYLLKVATNYVFTFFLVEVLLLLLLLLLRAAASAHNISTEAEVLFFLFWWLRCCCSSLIERDALKKKKIRLCFLFDTGTQSIAFSVIGYVLQLFLTAPGSCLQH